VDLLLTRIQLEKDFTIGHLQHNSVFECWTCEDTVRPAGEKIYGQTAIPYGRYEIIITFSNRFKRPLPLLLNVPMFEGIRIHPGNTAQNTEGCLLPGLQRLPNGVGQSKAAFEPLFNKIHYAQLRHESVFISIVKAE
jgi:hypothetical protein